MKAARIILAAVAIIAMAAVGTEQLSAQTTPPAIAVTELTPRSEVTDRVALQFRVKHAHHRGGNTVINLRDPSLVTTAEILVQPGAKFPWHQHAGPVIVTVATGELVYVQAHDCAHHAYPAGTVFIDPGNVTHSAYNPTNGVTKLIATFFNVAPTGPLTLTAGVQPGTCPLP